jgi:hypothetical protein
MEQVGQHLLQVCQQQEAFLGGCGTQSISFSIWWRYSTSSTAATEEWTGAGAPLTKTITVS